MQVLHDRAKQASQVGVKHRTDRVGVAVQGVVHALRGVAMHRVLWAGH